MAKTKVGVGKDPKAANEVLTHLDTALKSQQQGATKDDQSAFYESITANDQIQKANSKDYHDASSIRDMMGYVLRDKKEEQFKDIRSEENSVALFTYGSGMLKRQYLDAIGYSGSSDVDIPSDSKGVKDAIASVGDVSKMATGTVKSTKAAKTSKVAKRKQAVKTTTAAKKALQPPVILRLSPKFAAKKPSKAVTDPKQVGDVEAPVTVPPAKETKAGPSSGRFIANDDESSIYTGEPQPESPQEAALPTCRKRRSNDQGDSSQPVAKKPRPQTNQAQLKTDLVPQNQPLDLQTPFLALQSAITTASKHIHYSHPELQLTKMIWISSPLDTPRLHGLLKQVFGTEKINTALCELIQGKTVRDIKFVQSSITAFLDVRVFQKSGVVDQEFLVDELAETLNELLCQCILPGEFKRRKLIELRESVAELWELAILVKGKMEACQEDYRLFRPTYGQKALLSDLWSHESSQQRAAKTAELDEMVVTLCHLPGLIRVAPNDEEQIVVVLPEVGTMGTRSESAKTGLGMKEKTLFEPISAVPVAPV